MLQGGGRPKLDFARKHDIILRYSAGSEYTFRADAVRIPYQAEGKNRKDDSMWGRHQGSGKVYRPHPLGKIPEDWWPIDALNSNSPERTGYPTQKPLALLHRIVRSSSNTGDLVFDPFCGCATTLVAADDLGRSWVGVDISAKAADLVIRRISERQGLFREIVHRINNPLRTDLGPLPAYNSRGNRTALYGQQEGHCAGCGEHFQARHLAVDHIIAKSKGGTDHINNLQLLCGHCNSVKGDRGMEYLRVKLQLAS